MIRFALCNICVLCVLAFVQGPQVDYSKFLHTSQRHSSLACNSCHQRTDNSATLRFPGHSACTDCHRSQFTTPAIPMCVICHTNVSGNNPPLKNFPTSFNERFNVKFDHAQHNTGSARPQRGCAGCHNTPVNRGAGLSIPANLAGTPAMSVPSGLSDEDGLPVGLQIMAPALQDHRMYRVAAAYEAARGAFGGPSL